MPCEFSVFCAMKKIDSADCSSVQSARQRHIDNKYSICNKNKNAYNTCCSRVVPHPSTRQAQARLTSEF